MAYATFVQKSIFSLIPSPVADNPLFSYILYKSSLSDTSRFILQIYFTHVFNPLSAGDLGCQKVPQHWPSKWKTIPALEIKQILIKFWFFSPVNSNNLRIQNHMYKETHTSNSSHIIPVLHKVSSKIKKDIVFIRRQIKYLYLIRDRPVGIREASCI